MDLPYIPLKDRAIEILGSNKGRWRTIARETQLNYDWLAKLSQGLIDDPGAGKLEKLIAWANQQEQASQQ